MNKIWNKRNKFIFFGLIGIVFVLALLNIFDKDNGILKKTVKASVVNCRYNGDLIPGLTFTEGQYVYIYKMYRGYTKNKSGFNLYDLKQDGWSVYLNDYSSSKPITSKLCTYINDKPIVTMESLFERSNAESIDLSSFNTENVVNMSRMFAHSKVKKLDLSRFNTSNVTDMRNMFENIKLDKLDLTSFDTKNVNYMSDMFSSSEIKKIDLSSFNTRKTIDMKKMFSDFKTESLDLSSFKTPSLYHMDYLFSSAEIPYINLGEGFSNEFVESMANVFTYLKCDKLEMPGFKTSNVENMEFMFNRAEIKNIDLSSFDTSNVYNMKYMFAGSKIPKLDLSNFNTSNNGNLITMEKMFYGAEIPEINLSSFDTTNAFVKEMFIGFNTTKLDLSNFVLKDYAPLLFQANRIDELDISGFDAEHIHNLSFSAVDSESNYFKKIYVKSEEAKEAIKNLVMYKDMETKPEIIVK